ncbi:hypothetical protein V2J09_003999 [Rumex salicifolius]
MLGAWRCAPYPTFGLLDHSNNYSFFPKCRLNASRNNFCCSSSPSTSTSSYSVADEEEEDLSESTMPSVSPNQPMNAKPIGKRKGKRVKVPSGIQVPRQKHIAVSKSELLEALVNAMSASHQQSADQLVLISTCLDSILHAEHRHILEEMRADYSLAQSIKSKEGEESKEGRETFPDLEYGFIDNKDNSSKDNCPNGLHESQRLKFPFHLDLMHLFGSHIDTSSKNDDEKSRAYTIASATRFQRSFMNLLHDAQFEELSARDLTLTSALNTDYLLTLPIYVDWEKASDSNAIIFRRGYTTEKEQGMLVVDKLDYLQSRLIQAGFGLVSKPLRKLGLWINEALNSFYKSQEKKWINRIQIWINEVSRKSSYLEEQTSETQSDIEQQADSDLPIWLASQRAVTRYEGFLSGVGPRGILLRKLLSSIGLLQTTPEINFELGDESDTPAESYMRPVFLPRVSLNDIWRPATRKVCGNNIWKMLKTGISVIFSDSVLQEPAFRELILLYTEKTGEKERDRDDVSSLQLKIYEKIPIPDLPVVFPHKKLSFRILDMVRLDIATILGLLAYFINYKFEDVVSSPSAVLLDVVAVTALLLFVSRVALGYKQTWDRYQLLVNKTLYEKTLASGFGAVYFLLDASEQQQYKECILTYALLLKADNGQVVSNKILAEECELFLYEQFKEKVEMPVEKAVKKLVKFGLVREHMIDGKTVLQVVPGSVAYNSLRKHWDSLLT